MKNYSQYLQDRILQEKKEVQIFKNFNWGGDDWSDLNQNTIVLKCSDCNLDKLPKLPDSLQDLRCDYNPLECLIPEKFYPQQEQTWLQKYLTEIKTYKFQKRLLQKDPNQISELIQRNILHDKIRKEYSDLIDSTEWGLI